ncbi:MAG: hypothetical protein R3B46_01885 [Phycisphaerales bacterium]
MQAIVSRSVIWPAAFSAEPAIGGVGAGKCHAILLKYRPALRERHSTDANGQINFAPVRDRERDAEVHEAGRVLHQPLPIDIPPPARDVFAGHPIIDEDVGLTAALVPASDEKVRDGEYGPDDGRADCGYDP